VAQSRVGSAGENRGHAAAVGGEDGVADRVDAPVDPVQPACRHAVRNRTATEPKRLELRPRDDAVLARRKHGNLYIPRVNDELCTYVVHFSPFVLHRPSVAGKHALGTRRT
jgi:hypothetical protein